MAVVVFNKHFQEKTNISFSRWPVWLASSDFWYAHWIQRLWYSKLPVRNFSAWFLDWDKSALCCCCCCNRELPPSCFWMPRPANKRALSIAAPPMGCPKLPAWWSCCNKGFCDELKLGEWRPELDEAGVLRGSCPSCDSGFCMACEDRPEPILPTAPRLPEDPSTLPVRGCGGNEGSCEVGVAGVVGRDDEGMLSPVSGSSWKKEHQFY